MNLYTRAAFKQKTSLSGRTSSLYVDLYRIHPQTKPIDCLQWIADIALGAGTAADFILTGSLLYAIYQGRRMHKPYVSVFHFVVDKLELCPL